MKHLKLLVKRDKLTSFSTTGQLFVDGNWQCYTLEPPTRSDTVKPRAIPSGVYELQISHSPRFNRQMPHVLNVPDFEGILIHWGNFAHDTEGCLLVGKERGPMPDFVGDSQKAFGDLFAKLLSSSEPSSIAYEAAA